MALKKRIVFIYCCKRKFNCFSFFRLRLQAFRGVKGKLTRNEFVRFAHKQTHKSLYKCAYIYDCIFPIYNIRFIALNDNVDTANKDTLAIGYDANSEFIQ